jgi:hypothetical protein
MKLPAIYATLGYRQKTAGPNALAYLCCPTFSDEGYTFNKIAKGKIKFGISMSINGLNAS